MKTLLLLLSLGTFTLNAQILDTARALVEINTPNQADAYPYVTNDGLRLYYTNNNTGSNDLYFTSRTHIATSFNTPQLVEANTFQGIISSWFSENELEIYYSTGSAIFHAARATTSSPFGAATQLTLTGNSGGFISSQSLTPNADELFVHEAGVGLVRYTYTSPFTYSMQGVITPPAGLEGSRGQLTKDGLGFYWSLSPAAASSTELYTMSRANLGDNFGVPSAMNVLINDGSFANTQASYATTANVLVWVRGTADLWSENELYVAYNKAQGVANLIDVNANTFNFSAFPNPFSSTLNVRYTLENAETVNFVICDEMGRNVKEFTRNSDAKNNNVQIDLSELNAGTYFITLFNDRFTETKILTK